MAIKLIFWKRHCDCVQSDGGRRTNLIPNFPGHSLRLHIQTIWSSQAFVIADIRDCAHRRHRNLLLLWDFIVRQTPRRRFHALIFFEE
ncbi:hypothetical protein TSMEX_005097 [Taenia solium]|eukprot:TsM_000426900 transcript=TsM_000426900 gene=TsM_000426900